MQTNDLDNDKSSSNPLTLENNDKPNQSTRGGRRPGAGRKPVQIDLDVVEGLSAFGCTNEEIAGFCRCSVRTLETYLKKPEFAEARAHGSANLKISVRRLQLKAAQKGDVRMLMFLGKQLLNQRDILPIDGRPPYTPPRVPLAMQNALNHIRHLEQMQNANPALDRNALS